MSQRVGDVTGLLESGQGLAHPAQRQVATPQSEQGPNLHDAVGALVHEAQRFSVVRESLLGMAEVKFQPPEVFERDGGTANVANLAMSLQGSK